MCLVFRYFVYFYLFYFLVGYSALTAQNLSSPVYECSGISLIYGSKSDDLPSLSPLGQARLTISSFDSAITLAQLMDDQSSNFTLTLQDLHRIGEVPLHYLRSLGYEGLVVFPDPKQIDPVSGKDLRQQNDKELRFMIWVSRLQSVELENGGIKQATFIRLQSVKNRVHQVAPEAAPAITSKNVRFWNRFSRASSRRSQVILSPGDQAGHVVAVLKVRPEEKPSFSLQSTNSGTSTTGKWILGGTYSNDQLSGADDRLDLSYLSSDTGEREAYNVSYQRPILYPDILELGVSFGFSNYDASSFAITRIDFAGDTRSADLFARWNPLGTEFKNYSFAFELGVKGEQVKATNSLSTGEADANIITPRIAVKISTQGTYLRTESKLSLRGNVHSIQDSDQSLLGGVNTQDKFERLSITYLESLKFGKWLHDQFSDTFSESWADQTLVTRFQGDLALRDQRHLPQHQFITGGTGSVRGYPESPIAGDSGYSLSIEHRIPLPAASMGKGKSIQATVIPFVDWGETMVTDPLFYESDHSIIGAGIGLELKTNLGAMARIDFAQPLREVVSNGNILAGTRSSDHRVHASLRWEF